MAVVVMLLILFLSAAWFLVIPNHALTPEKQDLIAEIELQRSRWIALKPARFKYRITRKCIACNDVVEVLVTGDNIQATLPGDTGAEAAGDERLLPATISIEDLFDVAAGAARTADRVDVAFHARYRFPSKLEIDWSSDVADDEDSYLIERFVALH